VKKLLFYVGQAWFSIIPAPLPGRGAVYELHEFLKYNFLLSNLQWKLYKTWFLLYVYCIYTPTTFSPLSTLAALCKCRPLVSSATNKYMQTTPYRNQCDTRVGHDGIRWPLMVQLTRGARH